MDQKRLFAGNIENQSINEPISNTEEDLRRSKGGALLRTGLRASKRSLRNMGQADMYTPARKNTSKPLINTKALRYNPSGPGDYNIPSSFGQLPPVRGQSGEHVFHRKESNVLKKNPSFSMGARIENNRVFKSHMQKFMGLGTPGVGTYDPLQEGLEDKRKLKMLKRLNMYAASSTRQGKNHTMQGTAGQSRSMTVDPDTLAEQATQLVKALHARAESGVQQNQQPVVAVGEMPKLRHLSPNMAASSRNRDLNDMFEPNADKSFGTQKRFFQPKAVFENADIPIQYESKYTSLVKSHFSTNMGGGNNKTSKTSLNSAVRNTPSASPTRHQKDYEYHMILGKTGRPIFAKDKDKHETPAPAYYRPEVFEAYQSKTRFNESRRSIPKQERFIETAHFRFADDKTIPNQPPRANKQVCYAEQEKRFEPGPGYYEDSMMKHKRQVLHSIPSQDRNLLVNPQKSKSDAPGPQSYDLVTGLSMTSSTKQIVPEHRIRSKQISPQPSVQEFMEQQQMRVAGNASAARPKQKSTNDDLMKKQSVNSNRSRSNSNIRKFASVQHSKNYMAPKLKMGVFGHAKRNTEFNNEFV